MTENTTQKFYKKLESEENFFFRYALVIEYLGSSFAGSQIQPEQRTVQSELENALEIILKEKVKTYFSGRTDKGVHARNQVIHFDLTTKLDKLKLLLTSLNALLGDDISVKSINEITPNFHSQKNARFRWYRYVINNNYQRSVWLKNISTHVKEELNVSEMQKALEYLKGKNDFTSFKNAHSVNPAKDCEMYYVNCKAKSGIITIDLIANRFLYNMVRIIIGTLIDIGKGLYPAEHMLKVLKSKDRKCAGETAKAAGLTLMLAMYNEQYNINQYKNKMEAHQNENLFSQAS